MAQTDVADACEHPDFKLAPGFLSERPLNVAVVGVGGTGSELTSKLINLHLALMAKGYGGLHVVAFDPDTVSPSNIVRQRYTQADIGRPKATVLINRINFAYALGWGAVEGRFDAEYAAQNWDLVISCVDTRKSRKELHRYAFRDKFSRWKFWLDCGNDKYTGQVILGTPRSKRNKTLHMLPCATELHPELMDTRKPEDDVPSCSAAESLNHQDLMVNSMAATLAANLLWRVFNNQKIDNHAYYFNLEGISLDPRRVPPPQARANAKKTETPKAPPVRPATAAEVRGRRKKTAEPQRRTKRTARSGQRPKKAASPKKAARTDDKPKRAVKADTRRKPTAKAGKRRKRTA
jgi:PRTRC genetic system ThiF family protein